MNANIARVIENLQAAGMSYEDAVRIRKDALILRRWHDRECGEGNGFVERDEKTEKTYWVNANTGRRTPTPDRETPARKRIKEVIGCYPELAVYIQRDPRGPAIYVIRKGDVPEGQDVLSFYNCGIAVY